MGEPYRFVFARFPSLRPTNRVSPPQSNQVISTRNESVYPSASRFEARINQSGASILYSDQDQSLWNQELIDRGIYFMNNSAVAQLLSKYHLEAGIAFWHTRKDEPTEKWQNILGLYNQLVSLENSSEAALNRVYALSKAY